MVAVQEYFLFFLFVICLTSIRALPVPPSPQAHEGYAVPYPAPVHAYPSQPQHVQSYGYANDHRPIAYPSQHHTQVYQSQPFHPLQHYSSIHQPQTSYPIQQTGAPAYMPHHSGSFQAASGAHKIASGAAADVASVAGPQAGQLAYQAAHRLHQTAYHASNAVASTIRYLNGGSSSSLNQHHTQYRSNGPSGGH